MEAKKVLIIENDPAVQQMLRSLLTVKGLYVCDAYDGERGLHEFSQQAFDLVLLDIMLPQLSGWEVLRQVRQRSQVPVIIITALFRKEYISHATQYGAILLTKPFSCAALRSAVEAALRWSMHLPDSVKLPALSEQRPPLALSAKPPSAVLAPPALEPASERAEEAHLQIDLTTRRVVVQGKRVKLTATEFRLLACLVNHADQVLTYRQILEAVWGWEYQNSTHYVHVFISQLRQKLEVAPNDPQYLLTERGVGYWFAWR
jgi:two-component system, OmpR family, KDP operon response regulator KdpE